MMQTKTLFQSKKALRKALSLLLVLAMALSLAACGKDQQDGNGAQTLSGTVYVPEFIDLDMDLNYIRGSCSDGKNVYLLGDIYEEVEATDPVTGDTYTGMEDRSVILCVPLDGGASHLLENYTALSVPEGYEGSSYAQSISIGADGTLWVGERLGYYTFDLPENFDPETESRWQYQSDYMREQYQRQLDTTGSELKRIDTTDLRDRVGVGASGTGMAFFGSSSDVCFDDTGHAYAVINGTLYVMTADLEPLFSLEADNLWESPIRLGDGTMAVRVPYSDLVTNTYGYQLRTIDMEKQDWGVSYLLPSGVYDAYPGGGDYLFYYRNNDVLYGCKPGEDVQGDGKRIEISGEKLLSWIDADINADNIELFDFLADGRVVVMTRAYVDRVGTVYELALLTETDRSTLPEKTTLVYGTMSLGYDARTLIIAFNKSSARYRIEVRDYSQYNTGDDPSGGLNRLNAEVVAGTIPDILDTNNMPISQLAGKGLLADLWPFIEGDPDLGRDAVMAHVFDVASDGQGRLFQIFPSFTIQSVAGAPGVVGNRMSWTLADLRAALDTMPEGCTIFSDTDTAPYMLQAILAQNLTDFVDWETGTCSFDSDEFRAILEFCASFPADFDRNNYSYEDGNDEPTRISEGRQMLLDASLYSWEEIQMHKAIFGGAVSYIGYPMEDGSCGSSFVFSTGMAMSGSCADQEGAWSFMRELLLPQYANVDESEDGQNMVSFGGGSFPTNKVDFDFVAKKAMTPRYRLDENGEPMLDENGKPIEYSNWGYGWGSVQIDIYSTSQEEYDQIMALYNAVERVYAYDQQIFTIISDIAAGYFAGDTTLDSAVTQIQSRVYLRVNESR